MFKKLDANDLLRRHQQQISKVEENAENTSLATGIVFVTLAENAMIDDVTATEHTDLFAAWESDIAYAVGNIRRHNGDLYKCLQAHTSQDDWTPDISPSLWKKIGDPTVEYPEWSQPIGAADAYRIGDKVTHNGKRWVSTADGNVWEPGVYGWKEVE